MRHHSHQPTSDWLVNTAKSNPEGLLLLAAGCALLLRSGGSSDRSERPAGRRQSAQPGGTRQRTRANESSEHDETGYGIAEAVSQTADSAREYASDLGKKVSETAGGYASTVSDYADTARRSVADQSEHMIEHAQDTFRRVLQEQPLAIAALGLAAGAAVALALPMTAVEREQLGPARGRISEAASSAGEQLREAGSKAGERLMDIAGERGLSSSGLKEAAEDVAGTFGSALRGEQAGKEGSTSRGAGGSSISSGASSKPAGTQRSS